MILERHIGSNLVRGWLMALAVLAAVFGLISFIEELDKAKRDYDTLAAASYALRVLPNQLISLAPVIALLGSIVALAGLDRYKELTVISASGFSLARFVAALLAPTALLMATLWLGMEYVTPRLQQSAEQDRTVLRQGEDSWIPGGGLWSTDGRRYIHLGGLSRDQVPAHIRLFEVDDNHALVRALRAVRAEIGADRNWLLQDVREKRVLPDELRTLNHRELDIPNLWAKDELPTLTLQRDTMTLSVLYRYTQYLASNGQPVERYLSDFWQKLLMPFTVLAMVLLAAPISAGVTAGRDRSVGLKLGIGAAVGIGFYLGAQIVFALGQLLDWNIPLVAALPALVILACAAVLLRRMRW